MNLEQRIESLTALGWDADMCDTADQHFEALVHELAHNLVMGDMTPKHMGDTARLISQLSVRQADLDEALTTAVTIQVLETHYGLKGSTTDIALESADFNVSPGMEPIVQELVVSLIDTPRVLELASQLFQYIEERV